MASNPGACIVAKLFSVECCQQQPPPQTPRRRKPPVDPPGPCRLSGARQCCRSSRSKSRKHAEQLYKTTLRGLIFVLFNDGGRGGARLGVSNPRPSKQRQRPEQSRCGSAPQGGRTSQSEVSPGCPALRPDVADVVESKRTASRQRCSHRTAAGRGCGHGPSQRMCEARLPRPAGP